MNNLMTRSRNRYRAVLVVVLLSWVAVVGGCLDLSDADWERALTPVLTPALYEAVVFHDLPESSAVVFVEEHSDGAASAILLFGSEKRGQYLRDMAGLSKYDWIESWPLRIPNATGAEVLSFVRSSVEMARASQAPHIALAYRPESNLHEELDNLVDELSPFASWTPFYPEDFTFSNGSDPG